MLKRFKIPFLALGAALVFISLTSLVNANYNKSRQQQFLDKKLSAIAVTYQQVLKHLNNDINKFVELTPKQYREITGRKLSLKQALELRQMQRLAKKSLGSFNDEDEKMPQWAYVLLVVLGWGFIPIGIMSDWKGNDWWINLLLSFCLWIPGVIHGLIIMKKYY